MSSLFKPGGTTRKSPPWCKSRLFALPPAYVAGLPTRLVAFCRWYEVEPYFDVTESIQLHTDDELPGWSGASSDSGLNLQLKIYILPAKNRYTLNLILRRGTQAIDDDSWHDVWIPEPPPFDSDELEHGWPLGGVTAVHVID